MTLSDRKEVKEKDGVIQIGSGALNRDDTLHLKSEFNYVKQNGKKFVGRYMLLITAPSDEKHVRIGIICGKRFSKKAVTRNRARRLIKESFRLIKNGVRTSHCIFIVRQKMKNAKMPEVQKEMIRLMQKASLLSVEF
jgi:ribonuclease P protein component